MIKKSSSVKVENTIQVFSQLEIQEQMPKKIKKANEILFLENDD